LNLIRAVFRYIKRNDILDHRRQIFSGQIGSKVIICIIALKKKFYQRIANDLHAELKVRKEDVFISLVEVAKENWSFGNGEMQYGPKE